MATKTINLTGAEVAVTGLDGAHAHITNMGADIIYAAKNAGITAGADGVVPIPAGNGNTLRGISGAVYLMGTGSVLVQSDDYVQHPSFRNSTASGGSGVDDVARAALGAHEGNAEIHVTASEKASWDGKAELTDIPTSLPANGGNAEKVGGYSSNHILKYIASIPSNDCNDFTEAGWHLFNGCDGHAPGSNSTIVSGTYFILLNVQGSAPGYFVQIATFVHGWANYLGRTYIRHCNNGVWSDWDELIRRSDFDALEARVAALEGGTT